MLWTKTGDQAWFDDRCKKAAAKKRHLFKTMKENNTQENIDKFAEARKRYNHEEKLSKRRYNKKLKEGLSDSGLSSKQWWRRVNTVSEKSSESDIPVLKDGLLVCTSAKAKVEKLDQTFVSKCQLQHAEDPAPEVEVAPSKTLDTVVLKAKDIQQLLTKLNPDKVTGPEGV